MTTTSTQTETTVDTTASAVVTRTGLVGRAIYYFLLALFAVNLIDTGSGSGGAIEQVARAPFGRFLLVGVTLSLAALVAWKAMQAINGDDIEGSEPTDRAKYAAKGVAYLAVALTALGILVANWSSSQSSSSSGGSGSKEQATATVLTWPGGQFLVIGFGLAIVAFGVYEIAKYAVKAEFWHRFKSAELDDRAEQAVEWSGRLGYAGKGAITAIVGGFFVVAGIQHDPDEATGLSGAIADVADTGWGPIVLALISVGLFLYAIFSAIEAKYRPVR